MSRNRWRVREWAGGSCGVWCVDGGSWVLRAGWSGGRWRVVDSDYVYG